MLENNINLVGRIPNINKSNTNSNVLGYFENTNLCYSKEDIIFSYYYPEIYHDCLDCKDNSIMESDICKCKDGFNGIGYLKCYTGDYSECKYINNLLGKEQIYNCCYEDRVTCSENHITKL